MMRPFCVKGTTIRIIRMERSTHARPGRIPLGEPRRARCVLSARSRIGWGRQYVRSAPFQSRKVSGLRCAMDVSVDSY